MPYTLANSLTDIENRLVDTSGGTVGRDVLVRFINSNLRRARRVIDLPSSEIVTQLAIYEDVHIYSIPSGFKDWIGLYDNYYFNDNLNFKRVDEFDFWRNYKGGENLISEGRNGQNRSLLINLISKSLVNTNLHNCDTFDGNGTWTANTTTSDAATVASDTLYVREGSGSVRFNITVAQSVNNFAELSVSNMTAVDLSGAELLNVGTATMWVYLPSVATQYTSFTLRWGSSATAYYESIVTSQQGGASFVAGWNQLAFDWDTATTTGTPTNTAINYLLFRATYPAAMTNQTGLRIDNIVMRQKYFANVHYLTDNLVTDDDGTTQKETFDDQNDTSSTFNFDASFVDWVNFATLEEVFTTYIKDPDARALYASYRLECEREIADRFPGRREIKTKEYIETDDLAAEML